MSWFRDIRENSSKQKKNEDCAWAGPETALQQWLLKRPLGADTVDWYLTDPYVYQSSNGREQSTVLQTVLWPNSFDFLSFLSFFQSRLWRTAFIQQQCKQDVIWETLVSYVWMLWKKLTSIKFLSQRGHFNILNSFWKIFHFESFLSVFSLF